MLKYLTNVSGKFTIRSLNSTRLLTSLLIAVIGGRSARDRVASSQSVGTVPHGPVPSLHSTTG